ncbi:UvrD-helicase domain-containing protein [uncultured Turicimonas sp.]|uniref:UvrD-helicase domain-containing protein n=1 Tax=uncultured Turicimonas sp. TaxID=1918607 RepID=UPI0028047213|nr:UvrD-helicase domain-containing protein [uncultured Turicimonas sp.]
MKTLNVFDPIHTSLTEPILIEASAGTGKTYSLMHLLLRLIVEKRIDIERILIVTFTKNATSELRNRLQQALLNILEIFQNESSWKQELDKLEDETLKSQIELWVQTGAITPESIRETVTEALSKIEDASIFTIHSFCQRMVKDCSFSSRSDSDAEIGDTSGLISEVVDTFVRKEIKNVNLIDQVGFLKYPGFSKILERVSALSVRSPCSQSIIFDNTISFKQHLEKFRDEAPALLKKLKAAARTVTYDDLLVEMEARLDNPEFVKAVREKFDAVLIDEFQDTDPLQYTIFSELFLKAPERQIPVVFVGDPKQSIYGFRSADLDTYLDSKKDIKNHLYLKKNFRSTPGLVASINTFFGLNSSASGIGSFLNSKIQYTDVEFNSSKLPLFERTSDGKFIPLSSFEVWRWSSQEIDPSNVNVLEKYEDFFLAEKIKSLLEKDIRVGSSLRKLKPSDIAILVRRRKDADGLMEELTKRQIRFIIQSDERVLESQEAQDIAAILSAMENPKSLSAMTKARVTPIFGHSIKLIEEDVQASLLARERIEKANERAKKYGVLAAFTELFKEFEVEERLLPQINGQRALTNYRHILELLHEENRKIKTVSGLLRWLDRKASDGADQETLRLESDSDLVRIETIHKSKGLEYPVVILPRTVFMAGKNVVSEVNEIVNGVKVRKFLAEATQIRSYLEGKSYAYEEEQMERVRLLYVAMTRASSLLVLPMFFKQTSKYSKLKGEKETFPGLHGNYTKSSTLQALTGSFEPDKYIGPKTLFKTLDEELEKNNVPVRDALLEGTKKLSDDFIIPDDYSASLIRNFSTLLYPDLIPSPSRQVQTKELTEELTASDLSVGQAYPIFSAEWIRTSFSALSRGIEVLPEESPAIDELPSKDEIEEEVQVIEAQDNLRFKNPKLSAAAYGDFLHRLLEELDFRTADISNPEREDVLIPFVKNRLLSNAIETEVSEGESLESAVDAHTAALVEMITDVMNVKGIPGLENFSLSQLESDKKIAEMDFILSNPAISEDSHRLTGKQLGETLRRLDPRYPGLNLSEEQINGYLIGAIDLIFFAKGKFWVIDWKSNFLDENPSNYTKSLLDQAMDKKHYKLQYLLYLVVLKRYLETRFKSNDVYDLIGGAAYFFLRGIKASNPSQGIYFDRPKKEVLDCLDEILRNGYSEEIVQKYETELKGGNHAE